MFSRITHTSTHHHHIHIHVHIHVSMCLSVSLSIFYLHLLTQSINSYLISNILAHTIDSDRCSRLSLGSLSVVSISGPPFVSVEVLVVDPAY